VTRVLLSYAYPPFEAPRAVQVERLARHLDGPVEVVCGEVERISGPASSRPAEAYAPHVSVTRVQWGRRARALRDAHARLLRGRLDVPDRYRPWAADAAAMLRARPWRDGDVLVSFGQPWSDHVAALRAVRRVDVPWVAHFSDPWVLNPLREVPASLRPFDRRLERAVLRRADRVVFTNDETRELVMAAHPQAWRAKARVIPHAFDPAAHPARAETPAAGQVVVRHLGAFYAERTPAPLLGALRRLARERSEVLDGLRVELIGPSQVPLERMPELHGVPPGLVRALPPVDYPTSLRLMADAHLLVVVDAPAGASPFLPSKLVDYVGSGRPIVALSPPGPSAELVRRLGGWVADPLGDGAAAALADGITAARRAAKAEWGDPAVRAEYRADRVAAAFQAVLDEAGTARRR
jgi:hypothetical protein